MQVHCPRCSRVIPGEDFDLAAHVAVCRPCGEVVRLDAAAARPAPLPEAMQIYRPVDLRWTELPAPEGLDATITPRRILGVPLLGFAMVWNGFLFFWYSTVLHSPNPPLVALLFPVLHVGAGAFVLYQALCALFNRSYFRLDRNQLRFEIRPFRFGRPVLEPTANLDNFTVVEKASRSRSGTSYRYDVSALTRDGRALRLAVALQERAHADYVSARLAEVLVSLRRGDASTYRT